MSKVSILQQNKEDYMRVWEMFPFDYELGAFPIVHVHYADVLQKQLFYPVNKLAYGFAILMRRKAFTKEEITFMRDMGIEVKIDVRKIQLPLDCR